VLQDRLLRPQLLLHRDRSQRIVAQGIAHDIEILLVAGSKEATLRDRGRVLLITQV
jgi:hypothetical protein